MAIKFLTFRLIGDAKPRNWGLPMNEVLIERVNKEGESEGLKKVKYVPGMDSYFVEDQRGDQKGHQIWFAKGELIVPENDKVLVALLKAHPWFNKRYYLYDPEAEAKKKLQDYKTSSAVARLIDEACTDDERIKAIALGVFGLASFAKDPATCELELRELANTNPMKLQKELNSKNYESMYAAALAFHKGVVTEDAFKSAVLWNDSTKSPILRLAKGEIGIDKLGKLLSEVSEESTMLLQEIHNRLNKKETKTTEVDLLSEKDAEIAELKAKLKAASTPVPPPVPPSTNGVSKLSIEQAREKYKAKHNKNVPINKSNDLDWIVSRL